LFAIVPFQVKPQQVLHFSGIRHVAFSAEAALVAEMAVKEHIVNMLNSRGLQVFSSEVQRHVAAPFNAEPVVTFTARFAFRDAHERSLAYNYATDWKKNLGMTTLHLTERNARTSMKMAYISIIDVLIPRMLQTGRDLQGGTDPIEVHLGIWADNADAVTASMIFLQSDDLWASGESGWELALYLVGGEEDLKVAFTCTDYLEDLERVCDVEFLLDGRKVHVFPTMNINDHKCHGTLGGIPGGTSDHRSPFTLSLARYFGWIAFQCQTDSTVAFQNKQFEEMAAFLETRQQERKEIADRGVEQIAAATAASEDIRFASCIWKKIMSRPVLALARNTTLLQMRNYPPTLHVIVSLIKTMFALFLVFVLHPTYPSRTTFEANLATAQSFTEKGDLVASGQTYRSSLVEFRAQCEADLISLTPYYAIPRLLVYVQKILYHPRRNDPGLILLLYVSGFHAWLLTSCMSAFFGGKQAPKKDKSEDEKKTRKRRTTVQTPQATDKKRRASSDKAPATASGEKADHPDTEEVPMIKTSDVAVKKPSGVKLHTDSNYWHSVLILCEMAAMFKNRVPCEELGESFFRHHQWMTGLLRSKTLLKQELFHRTMTELRNGVAGKLPRHRSGHMPMRNDITLEHIIICRCVRQHPMRLRKYLNSTWTDVRSYPFCSFNSAAFIRRLAMYPELARRSFLLPSGHMYYSRETVAPNLTVTITFI
jgi:hypothetical protein